MPEFNVGDLVQGNGVSTGARYEGLVRRPSFLENGETYITITRNISRERGTEVGGDPGKFASINNVKKVETVLKHSDLVGPVPEPVKAPKHPTPWKQSGRDIVDANGRVVVRLSQGDYLDIGFGGTHLDDGSAFKLAEVISEAVNAHFGGSKVEDSKSPF